MTYATVVKRVLARTHERGGVKLKVIPVELDDDVNDLCRTFSVTSATEIDKHGLCALYNYLSQAGVSVQQLEWNDENEKIVVVVSSSTGMHMNIRAYPRTSFPCWPLHGKQFPLVDGVGIGRSVPFVCAGACVYVYACV